MKFRECLSFDDVLLVPQYSEITTRKDVDISNTLFFLGSDLKFSLPIISAPMDTITEFEMVKAMNRNGGLGIIHRYNTIQQQVNNVKQCECFTGAAVGANGDFLERAQALVEEEMTSVICIDVAHGDHILMKNALQALRKTLGDNVCIIAGNVATYDGALDLAAWGANAIKVGIGGGSICSTRMMTGHGIPTLQAIMDCNPIKEHYDVKLIADGGIRTPGDIAKAIAAGADFCMLGSMLAGTDETPGEVIEDDWSIGYKTYRGMASEEAQIAWRGKVGSKEGITTKVPCKGPVKNILDNIKTNLASALSYSGCRDINEFQRKAQFIKQTHAGHIEGTTHILK